MVILKQCCIKQGKLFIEAEIENLSYYDNVYIDSVIIDTDETFVENGPSESAIFTYQLDSELSDTTDCTVVEVSSDNKKIKLYLTAKDLGISTFTDNIFFIYVIATGTPDSCTPCGMDNATTLGIAIDMRVIYNSLMSHIRELADKCDTPRNLIDAYLRFKMIETALKTGNYLTAISYWQKFFQGNISSITTISKCGCSGT